MGTGNEVDFKNSVTGDIFAIEIDSQGNLNFLANNARARRMSILDDTNQVSFDGNITVDDTVTIGGSGQYGGLQLKASDGANTLYLGSSDSETTVQVGSHGRPGEVHVYDHDHKPTFNVYGDQALLTLGADGQAGDLYTYDSAGKMALSMVGTTGELGLHVDGHRTITLDGSQAKVTVGGTGDGVLELKDSAGTVRIRLSAASGTIEFFDATGASTATLP